MWAIIFFQGALMSPHRPALNESDDTVYAPGKTSLAFSRDLWMELS